MANDIGSQLHTRRRLFSLTLVAVAATALPFSRPALAETTLQKIKRTGVLKVGVSAAYAPFEYIADGKIIGYDVDLADAVAKRMAVKVEWQDIDFKGIVAALKSGRVDALFTALTETPQRQEQIDFSDAYYDAGIGCAKRAGSPIANPQDLDGKVVGVQIGSSGEIFVRQNVPGAKEVKTYDTILLALKDLQNKRVDAVVNPLPSIRYNIKGLTGIEVTKVWRTAVVAVGIRKGDNDLKAEINTQLAALKQQGFLASLDKKWF